MSHISLECTECGWLHEADMLTLHCGECGAPLDVRYADAHEQTIDWHGLDMPVPYHTKPPSATLGEGHTPVVRLPNVGDRIGASRIYGKLEFMNPTGSFKDRGAATMLSAAIEHEVTEIVEDSSGNAGGSVAAYAARAGIVAHIFAPSTAPEAKMGQIRVYQARAHPIPGPRQASTDAAIDYQQRHGIVYASHNLSPYFIEGTKTFAYEVATRMSPAPDHIVIPVGNGSLLLGAWKGYRELSARGAVAGVPRLHAVQAEAVMPIAAEFRGDVAPPGGSTVAGGIAVGMPPRKAQVLRAIRDSGGTAIAVDDDAIIEWHRTLASSEGIYAEPTSAAAFAGLERLIDLGLIGRDDVVLVPVTGFGLKDV